MKTAYLHIGLPKTGTTSIQTMYAMNPHLLTEAGFAFPPFKEYLSPEVTKTYITNGEKLTIFTANFSPEIDGYLQFLASKADKIFISSELLARCNPDHVDFIYEAFARNNIKLKIILVLRNLYEFFFSLWSQHVYNDNYRHSFPEFVILQKDLLPYATFGGSKIARCCPFVTLENFSRNKDVEITILHYDAIKRNLLEKFAETIGTRYSATTSTNIGMSYFATEALRRIHNDIHAYCSLSDAEEASLGHVTGNLAKMFSNIQQYFSAGEKKEKLIPYYPPVLRHLVKQYDSSVKKLNSKYNISLQIVTPEEKFCRPVDFEHKTYMENYVQKFYNKAIEDYIQRTSETLSGKDDQ